MAADARDTGRQARRDVVVALGDPKLFWGLIGVVLVSSAGAQLLDGWVRLVATPLVVVCVVVVARLVVRRRQPPG